MFDSTSSTSSTIFPPTDEDLPALSLWTFALGILALLTFGLTSLPAIICGHRALAEASLSIKGSLERSVALTGLIIGYVGAALLGMWIIFAARFLSMP
jgi:Na+-translocating ferredoxin:NAD+ oxidoreductase RnfD subunit